MAWLIGRFIGSFIGVLLITLILRATIFMKGTRLSPDRTPCKSDFYALRSAGPHAYVPIVTAVVISTVLYYFGGEGDFTILTKRALLSLVMYIISGVVIYETEKWMSK